MTHILDGKIGLIIDFEADGLNPQQAQAFQVSILFGQFGEGKAWRDKSFRIEGRPITDRYKAAATPEEVNDFPEKDICEAHDVFTKIAALIEKADIVCTWYQGYHLHLLATEMRRAGVELPPFYTLDAQLVFKEAFRYESGLKKSLDSAVDWYGSNMSDFGSPGSPTRKVFATRWVIDRMIEDDAANGPFDSADISELNATLAFTSASDHVGFKTWLKKKGKDPDSVEWRPWPASPDESHIIPTDTVPFSDYPEFELTFEQATNPEVKGDDKPIDVRMDSVYSYLTSAMVTPIGDLDPWSNDDKEVTAGFDETDGSFLVGVVAKKDEIRDFLKILSNWPVSLRNQPESRFKVCEVQDDGDVSAVKLLLVEKT